VECCRDGRTGPRIGGLPRIVTTQAVNTTTTYVIKVTDAFGQHDDATTKVAVVDTTGPTVKAPGPREAEFAGAFTPVTLEVEGDKASATDICDDSVAPVSDAPKNFPNGFPL